MNPLAVCETRPLTIYIYTCHARHVAAGLHYTTLYQIQTRYCLCVYRYSDYFLSRAILSFKSRPRMCPFVNRHKKYVDRSPISSQIQIGDQLDIDRRLARYRYNRRLARLDIDRTRRCAYVQFMQLPMDPCLDAIPWYIIHLYTSYIYTYGLVCIVSIYS